MTGKGRILVFLAACGLAACNSRGEMPPLGAPPLIQLTDAGRSPQKPLRFKFIEGMKQQFEMSLRMKTTMKIMGRKMSMDMPQISLGMALQIDEVLAGGGASYTFEITSVDVGQGSGMAAQLTPMIDDALQGIVGTTGSGTMDDRGIHSGMTMTMPEGADPQFAQIMDQMEQSMNQLQIGLPKEAVGVGATWESRLTLSQNGMTLGQIMKFELVEFLSANRVKIAIEVEQFADDQQINAPGMGKMVKATLESLESKGTGHMIVNLAKPSPTEMHLELNADMEMELKAMGQTQNMKASLGIVMDARETGGLLGD